MLVLSRKLGERIIIKMPPEIRHMYSDIYITVTELRKNGAQCKLGFEAPNQFAIIRKELLDAPRQVDPVNTD